MRFVPELIEEIRYRNSIDDVISGYVTLKRAGSNLQGLCPFHSEKSPSFTVFPATGSFYCFGCNAGGDIFTFIMKAENLDYADAVEFLAKRAGVPIPENEAEQRTGVKRSRVLEMNRIAARYFHEKLLESPAALEYLNGRKLQMPLIRRFGLGFAPDNFGGLTGLLSQNGFSAEEMKAAFLCGISQKTQRPYDYFRNRIIFPIIDPSGNVIAFGGRVMDHSEPKYLNTSDTPAFRKSRNLYALNFARKHCAETMILCEGYMDVIALHGAGFENAVATLGTALTPEQARIMKRYTQKVIISYDADEAGQRAAARAFELLSDAGLQTGLLKVPGAKDPDEFIKKYGADRFRLLLGETKSRFAFELSNVLSKYDVTGAEGRIKAAQELTGIIAGVHSASERELYIKAVSEKLLITPESLKNDVEQTIRRKTRQDDKRRTEQIIRKTEGYGDTVNPDRIRNPRATAAEETILGILLLFPELLGELKKSDIGLVPEDFITEFNRRVFAALLACSENGAPVSVSSLGEQFNEAEMGRIVKMSVDRMKLTKNDLDVIRDCAGILQEERQKSTLTLEELLRRKRKKQLTGKN